MRRFLPGLVTAMGALLLLAACDAPRKPYQPNTMVGPVEVAMLDTWTASLALAPSDFLTPDVAFTFTLGAARDLTRQRGFGHFQLLETAPLPRPVRPDYEPFVGVFERFSEETLAGDPAVLTVRMFPGPRPARAPANVFDVAGPLPTGPPPPALPAPLSAIPALTGKL